LATSPGLRHKSANPADRFLLSRPWVLLPVCSSLFASTGASQFSQLKPSSPVTSRLRQHHSLGRQQQSSDLWSQTVDDTVGSIT
ncbi:unnamed protein product, partial [Tilletia laevis]